MNDKSMAFQLGTIFSLKHVFLRDFDSTPLGLVINKTEERVLMMIWKNPGAPMQVLSREAGLEKGSLTTVIDSLEKKELVIRARGIADKRSFTVTLTPAGADLAERIAALFREHIEALLGKLAPEDRAEFERAIRTCARLVPILAS